MAPSYGCPRDDTEIPRRHKVASCKARVVRLLPSFVVDRLPNELWRPGNLRWFGPLEIHLCDDGHVKSIQVSSRVVARGRKLFTYGEFD